MTQTRETTDTSGTGDTPGTTDSALVRASQRAGDRVTGFAGVTFAVVVALQNIARGGVAPLNGASMQSVTDYYTGHRLFETGLGVTFVISGVAICVFLGGILADAAGPQRRWAMTGVVGGIGIVAVFTAVVGMESALVAVAAQGSEPAVAALWAAHNGLFSVLDLMIAVALFGLSRYTVSVGATPHWFSWLAPIGAVLLAVGAAGSPWVVDGRQLAPFGAAGAGFVVWVLYVLTTGVCLIRNARQPQPASGT